MGLPCVVKSMPTWKIVTMWVNLSRDTESLHGAAEKSLVMESVQMVQTILMLIPQSASLGRCSYKKLASGGFFSRVRFQIFKISCCVAVSVN